MSAVGPRAPRPGRQTRQVAQARQVEDHAALLALTDGDAWVRWAVPRPLDGLALTTGEAVAVERRGRRRGWWLWPLPPARRPGRAVAAALQALREEGRLAAAQSVSVPRDWAAVRDRLVPTGDGGDWEWMWTGTAPAAVPGEEHLVELSDRGDAEEIMTFARTHSPRTWADAGSGRTELWLGLRDAAGRLRAVGGMERLDTGAPHLTGIVIGTAERRQGLGRVVTAALARRAIDDSGVCTLGVYADNVAAVALYHQLGFRTAHAWSTRSVAAPLGG